MERSTRRYPDMEPRAVAFAGTARTPVQNQVFVDTLVELMISDPEFRNGFYADSADVHVGLRRPLAFSLMGLSAAFYRNELWRGLGFVSADDFREGFIREDLLFPPEDCRADCDPIPNGRYRPIETPMGHFGMFGRTDLAAPAELLVPLGSLP